MAGKKKGKKGKKKSNIGNLVPEDEKNMLAATMYSLQAKFGTNSFTNIIF